MPTEKCTAALGLPKLHTGMKNLTIYILQIMPCTPIYNIALIRICTNYTPHMHLYVESIRSLLYTVDSISSSLQVTTSQTEVHHSPQWQAINRPILAQDNTNNSKHTISNIHLWSASRDKHVESRSCLLKWKTIRTRQLQLNRSDNSYGKLWC